MEKLLNDLSSEFLKCPVCRNPYDEDVRTARFYPCSHTTCHKCMDDQFRKDQNDEYFISCPVCDSKYDAPFPNASNYEKSRALSDLDDFISTKKKEEICNKCSIRYSDAECKDCKLYLCKFCNDEVNTGNNSNHNVAEKHELPFDDCQMCAKDSHVYCGICTIFLCNICNDKHHHEQSIGAHKVFKVHESNTTPMGIYKLLRTACISMRRAFQIIQTFIERCLSLIWKLFAFWKCLLVTLAVVVILVMPVLYINNFPAFIMLQSGEVEPISIICRHETNEVRQKGDTSQTELLRTLCTFNLFHYDFLNRGKTYFVIDININIAKTYQDCSDGKLFTIKIFLHKEHHTYHTQRRKYWSVTRCSTTKDELAICLEGVPHRTKNKVSKKIISRVMTGQNKIVSFLFLVDNEGKVMEIFSPALLWKDVVFLEHHYESKNVQTFISLDDSKHDKYITAEIRSGTDVTIGDLSPNAIDIFIGLLINVLSSLASIVINVFHQLVESPLIFAMFLFLMIK